MRRTEDGSSWHQYEDYQLRVTLQPDRGSHTVRLTQCCPFTVRILTRGTYGRVLDGKGKAALKYRWLLFWDGILAIISKFFKRR